jgi:putative transposase
MSTTLKTELVLDALNLAVTQRRPAGVVHHSDRGSRYTWSLACGHRCRQMGVEPSMGSRGDAYDNALAECFFASLECELLDRHRFPTQTEARLAVFRHIEGCHNPIGATPLSASARSSPTKTRPYMRLETQVARLPLKRDTSQCLPITSVG